VDSARSCRIRHCGGSEGANARWVKQVPAKNSVLRLHRSEHELEACIPSGYSEHALIEAAQATGPMKLR
jgi:hypothetical protein